MRNFAFVCLFTVFQSLLCADDTPTFYAVLVGDTHDKGLKKGIEADLSRYKAALTSIIEQINYKPQFKIINGILEKDDIENELKSINAGPNDIVFFMYSGHGGYDPYGFPWPVLALRYEPEFGIAGKAVVDLLLKGKQCLTYIFFDACNKEEAFFLFDDVIKKPEPMFVKGGHYPGVKRLFLRHKGYVIATSSKRYEYSYTDSKHKPYGSLFLTSLIFNLIEGCSEKRPTWENILEDASLECIENSREYHRRAPKRNTYEHPYYEISIHSKKSHKSKTKKSF